MHIAYQTEQEIFNCKMKASESYCPNAAINFSTTKILYFDIYVFW